MEGCSKGMQAFGKGGNTLASSNDDLRGVHGHTENTNEEKPACRPLPGDDVGLLS